MPHYQIERSREIDAPLEKVFQTLVDLKTWGDWDPWRFTDSQAEFNFSPSTNQVGSQSEWDGKIIGKGCLTITAIKENEEITHKLEFLKPFKTKSDVYFRVERAGEKTKVYWGMRGKLPLIFGFMKDMMERSLNNDYDLGLDRLAILLDEKEEKFDIELGDVETLPARDYVGIPYQGDLSGMSAAMPRDFLRLMDFVRSEGLEIVGFPFGLYKKFDMKRDYVECVFAVPVKTAVHKKDIVSGTLPSGKAFTTTLKGNYHKLSGAWEVAYRVFRGKGYRLNKSAHFLEEYPTDPRDAKNPLDIVTILRIPVR